MPNLPVNPTCHRDRPAINWIDRPLFWVVLIGFMVGSPRLCSSFDDRSATSVARLNWDDPSVPAEERGRRALDEATSLDQLAQRSSTVTESRLNWLQAAKLLDACVAKNGSIASAPSLQFQAAVYLWARSRSLLDQVDLLVETNPERLEVVRGFDDVIVRLRAILAPSGDPSDPFTQNVRFRLAQAIADRARLRPETDPARKASEKEAQSLLDRSINTPRLRSFARLLHAELSNRLGQFGPAQIEIEEAEKLDPSPPIVASAGAKIDALAGRGQFAEALQVAARTQATPEQKTLWQLRIVLAQRKLDLVGRDRSSNEGEVFRVAAKLDHLERPEPRRGLMELARAIEEPPANSPAEWWGLLAEGHLLLLEPERAAKLAAKGAARADSVGSEAAVSLRFKAGACWFQAERYAEADPILGQVIADPKASRSLQAKAGMLRALGRGRALAGHQPGASKASYLSALEAQMNSFPDEPVSGEARWLLGRVRIKSDQRDAAIALWSGIAHSQGHWLEAQLSAADQAIEAIQDQWTIRERSAVRGRVESARKMIRHAFDQASEGDESVELGIRLARLESIPEVGQPSEAVALLDRLLRAPASTSQHRQIRLARMVALAELNRFAEAESVARNEAKGEDLASLWPAIRTLDKLAGGTDGDLIRKRTGALIRVLLDRWVDPIDRTPTEDRDEVRLRQARALIFTGEINSARKVISQWGGPSGRFDQPDQMRDLGDTYFRLEVYTLAADVERVRATKLTAGTPAWFDARYSLALALYRSDRTKEARRVIEATTILHPDLGGGEIRNKFERLGQKMSAE